MTNALAVLENTQYAAWTIEHIEASALRSAQEQKSRWQSLARGAASSQAHHAEQIQTAAR